MKKRVLSIILCMTMTLFAGCGSADQKKADNTEAVQETSTLSKLMDKDSTEEATEAAEVTESTEASETADLAASADTSSETASEASASGNDAAASGTAKADTKNKAAAKSGSKSDSGSASQASQPIASGSGSAKADTTTQAAAPAQPQQTTSAQPASQPQPAAHEHQWEQYVKDTINHPETGHYETKVVQAAYDEPQYIEKCICGCGKTFDNSNQWLDHSLVDDCPYGYSVMPVQVGTIHHDAVTEQVWVVDQAAYTENVYGYRCSCGATK